MPDWRTARPMSPYHKGDGQRHRRHPDDNLPGGGLREEPAPPRRVRHGRRPRPADDERRRVDPRAGARDRPAAAGLPRREVAGHAAPLRPRRPARGGRRQHRQLRRRDVHGAGRHRQRRRRRPAPTPRRSRSRALTSPATAGRPQAVFAAAVAAAMAPGATVDSVVATALRLATRRHSRRHRGRRRARPGSAPTGETPIRPAARRGRARTTRSGETTASRRSDARRPVALQVDRGAARGARPSWSHRWRLRAARCSAPSNYGRDSDSIATMAGAVCGAPRRRGAVPAEWLDDGRTEAAGST